MIRISWILQSSVLQPSPAATFRAGRSGVLTPASFSAVTPAQTTLRGMGGGREYGGTLGEGISGEVTWTMWSGRKAGGKGWGEMVGRACQVRQGGGRGRKGRSKACLGGNAKKGGREKEDR